MRGRAATGGHGRGQRAQRAQRQRQRCPPGPAAAPGAAPGAPAARSAHAPLTGKAQAEPRGPGRAGVLRDAQGCSGCSGDARDTKRCSLRALPVLAASKSPGHGTVLFMAPAPSPGSAFPRFKAHLLVTSSQRSSGLEMVMAKSSHKTGFYVDLKLIFGAFYLLRVSLRPVRI